MLIRSNTLNEADGFSRSKLFNEPVTATVTPVPNPTNLTTPSNTSKLPQNRYEALFIKLFAQTTLQLMLSFSAILLLIVIVRDFIGKTLNLVFSLWILINLLLMCLSSSSFVFYSF